MNLNQNQIDRYLLANVPAVISSQRMKSETVEERVKEAISRIQTVSMDHYNNISVVSIYWESDDTGSEDDSSLFIQTISKLKNEETNLETHVRAIADGEKLMPLLNEVTAKAESMTGKRRLFILHYAGHAVAASTSDNLTITSRISQGDINGSHLNMTLIRDSLKDLASNSEGLDVLILLDCCCAAIAGRGRLISGKRVELMAATSTGGISNSRKDGKTFTEHWCIAFDNILELGQPFDCTDIAKSINSHYNLEQYPATFVLREGWGVPITFQAPASSTTLTPAYPSQSIITALHIVENADSDALQQLISYLQNAPVPITIIATLPISSTLLLLRVPVYLQEMLVLPRVSLILTDI